MVLEAEANWRQVIQGLMRSAEVVFDEPFGQPPVELNSVRQHVAQTEKLILERAVEPFIDRIVLGGLGPRPVMLKVQSLAGVFEMPVKLAAVVSLTFSILPSRRRCRRWRKSRAEAEL